MADLKMRPRFSVDVSCDAAAVVDSLRDRLGDADPALEASFNRSLCVLRIPEPCRAFYSPELEVTFEAADSEAGPAGGVRVKGLLGPQASVWTGYVFVYVMLSLSGFAGGLYGLVLLSFGDTSWALLVPPAALVLIAGVYASSFIGKGLALSQMYELRRYLDTCLEHAEAQGRAKPQTPLDSAML